VSPEMVRRLCWEWEDADDPAVVIDEFLRGCQARAWQRELVALVLAAALAPTTTTEIDGSAEKFD
jgi:ribonuclease D